MDNLTARDKITLQILSLMQSKAKNSKGYNPYRDSKGRFDDGPTVVKIGKMRRKIRDYKKLEPNEFAEAVEADYKSQATWEPEEVEAIDYYVGNGYQFMNAYLKDNNDPEVKDDEDYLVETIDRLDVALKNKLLKDTTLYRGFATNTLPKVGERYYSAAYSSTSFSEDAGMRFATGASYEFNKEHAVLFEIQAREGQRGLIPLLATTKESKRSLRSTEAEYLLPRDISFIIKSVEPAGAHSTKYTKVIVEIENE